MKSTTALTLPLLQQNPICKATEKRRQRAHTQKHTVLLAKKRRERESSLPRCHLSGLQKKHNASLKLPQAFEKLKEFLQRGTPTQDQTSLSSIYGAKTRLVGTVCTISMPT
jgi:hypothetical protein